MRLRCSIFKHQGSDCSNSGISSSHDHVILVWDEEADQEVINGTPVVKLVERHIGGRPHFHVEPVKRPIGAGWMYGGCIVCCSDSRFPSQYPLKLHDRQEF